VSEYIYIYIYIYMHKYTYTYTYLKASTRYSGSLTDRKPHGIMKTCALSGTIPCSIEAPICMYVCSCVHNEDICIVWCCSLQYTSACIYIYICMYIYIYIYVCACACLPKCKCMHIYIYTHIICVCICSSVRVYIKKIDMTITAS
jgi:hypothetical protein